MYSSLAGCFLRQTLQRLSIPVTLAFHQQESGHQTVAPCQIYGIGSNLRYWFTANRRDDPAHGLRLLRAKGRPASSRAIFSFSRSRSISAAPSLAFSRSLSSSSPVAARVIRATSPPARNASRQPLSVAAVTPSSRETVSRSSPRNSRSTAALLRWRDIRPRRLRAIAPRSHACPPPSVHAPT